MSVLLHDLHQLPARAQGFLRSLNYSYQAQTIHAIGFRGLIVFNAINKVLGLGLKRFGCVEPRRPHVAGSITYKHLINSLGALRNGDAFVVDLYFLAGLQVVVKDHLLAATDQSMSDFYRRKPVDVDVSYLRFVEKERDVGDVFRLPGNVADAGGRNSGGFCRAARNP